MSVDTSAHRSQMFSLERLRLVLILAAAATLAALLGVLTIAVKNNPTNSADSTLLERIAGWDLPGLTGFMQVISFLTDNYPGMALGLAGAC